MAFQIGIEVNNHKIAWVQSSDESDSVLTKLTTLTEHQPTAIINIYLKTSKGKFLLCTETIRGIKSVQDKPPAIDVTTRITGKNLHYRICLNGRIVADAVKSTRKHTRSLLPLIIILLIAALLASAAALFILRPESGKSPAAGGQNAETRQKTDKEEVPKQEPPPTQAEETKPAPPAEETTQIIPPAEEPVQTEKSSETIVEKEPVITWTESEIFDKHSVYFSPDSAVLRPETISELNSFISSLPEPDDFEEGFFELAVRGHCAKYGTEEGRADLSRERAFNVTNFLRNRWGIKADYTTSGAGASEPVTLKRDEQHLNRRVDIVIKGTIRKKIVTENQE